MKNDYLAHHGILGMKWGVRRYQGYDGKRISTPQYAEQNAQTLQRPFVKGKTVFDTAMYRIEDKLVDREIAAHKKQYKFEDLQKISGEHSADDDQKVINPEAYKNPGAAMNCMLCSAAYELRRRGYDVEANLTTYGRDPIDMARMFNLKNYYETSDSLGVKNCIEQAMPDGARGVMMIEMREDLHALHCMNWTKENGRAVIRDTQCDVKEEDFDKAPICKTPKIRPYVVMRLDDAEVNTEEIMDAVRPRRKS